MQFIRTQQQQLATKTKTKKASLIYVKTQLSHFLMKKLTFVGGEELEICLGPPLQGVPEAFLVVARKDSGTP